MTPHGEDGRTAPHNEERNARSETIHTSGRRPLSQQVLIRCLTIRSGVTPVKSSNSKGMVSNAICGLVSTDIDSNSRGVKGIPEHA